jgi:Ran GTPase-activating protein (RanGAP) involved in mRNA processing and transport
VALHDNEVAVILDEIKKLDKSSLKHLNLGGNLINTATAKSLSELIQSKNTFLEAINLGNKFRNDDIDAFIEDAIFKKQNSDSVEN